MNVKQVNWSTETRSFVHIPFDPDVQQDRRKLSILYPKVGTDKSVVAVDPEYLPTQKWLNDQANYISSLNDYDFMTVISYTVRSHQWIGPYLHSGGDTSQVRFTKPHGFPVPLYEQVKKLIDEKPFDTRTTWEKTIFNSKSYEIMVRSIPDDLLKRALDLYVKDLKRIISKAPPAPKTMMLFRGISDVHIPTDFRLNAFASASYVPLRGYGWNKYMRLKVLKGTRVLLLQCVNDWEFHGEYEVLLNIGSRFVTRKREIPRVVANRRNGSTEVKKITDLTVYS